MSGYMQLLILLMREIRSDNAYAAYPPVLARILDMIDSANHCNITIAEITAEKNISTRYLRKLFAPAYRNQSGSLYCWKAYRTRQELACQYRYGTEGDRLSVRIFVERHLHACFVRVMGYPPSRHLG